MTRIAPLEPPYPAEVREDFEAIMPPGVAPLAIFRTAARNPRILRKMRLANLLDRGSIGRRERELVILRACARAGAEYEWGVHVAAFGERVGITREQAQGTVTRAADDAFWDEKDGLLLALADSLHEHCDLDDALWSRLRAHWSEEQLVELVMLAGQYRMIGGFVRALRIAPEPMAPRFPKSG